MKTNKNSRRFSEQAKEALAQVLLFDLDDPEFSFITVTGTDVSVDKSSVQAYITTQDTRSEEALDALNRAKGRIRTELGRRLHWRVTPKIDFFLDPATKAAERLSYALQNVPPTLAKECEATKHEKEREAVRCEKERKEEKYENQRDATKHKTEDLSVDVEE